MFGLSPSYCGVWFVIDLLRHGVIHLLVEAIYLYYDDSNIYQIMIVNMLKNRSHKYSSHYIIKFVVFILIYYTINLYIVSFYMVITSLNQKYYFSFKKKKVSHQIKLRGSSFIIIIIIFLLSFTFAYYVIILYFYKNSITILL